LYVINLTFSCRGPGKACKERKKERERKEKNKNKGEY
jgi:hypothetical protein